MTTANELSQALETNSYYCVTSTYDDLGHVVCAVTDVVNTASRPANFYRQGRGKDIYLDFFDTLEEADEFVENIRRANATQRAV